MRKKTLRLASTISFLFFGSILCLPFGVFAGTMDNLVSNPDLETVKTSDASFPEHWNKGWWGDEGVAVFSYPASGADGTKGVKVELTKTNAGTNGDAKWFFDDVPILAENQGKEQYVFSDIYSVDVPADIVARYTMKNGEYQYQYLGTSVVSANFTGYQTLPFTAPPDAVSLTVFHLIHETGSLSIDRVSLLRHETEKSSAGGFTNASAPPATSVVGGIVPLSYLATPRGNIVAQNTPSPQTTFEQNVREKNSPTISLLAKNNTLSFHPTQTANTGGTISFVKTAEAETPAETYGAPKTGRSIASFSDATIVFLGLMLILFSIGLSFVLMSERGERAQETSLWES